MPDAYDAYLARKAGAAGPQGATATAEDPSASLQSFYRGQQESSGLREKPKEPDPYDQYLASKPMDFDTKRDLIRRLGLSDSVDPDYKDQANPRYRQEVDRVIQEAVPGASSMYHAQEIKKAIEKENPPTTAGETAIALAGDFNRAFLAPSRGIAEKIFGPGGPLESEKAYEASQGFGTGDLDPRLQKAREALDKTFAGSLARGAVALPGMITSMKGGGKGLQSVTGGAISGSQAAKGALGLYSGFSSGTLEGAGEGVVTAALGEGFSAAAQKFVSALPAVQKSLALQKIASIGTEGAGWTLIGQLLHGPNGKQAALDFLFGAGLSMAHGARSVGDRVQREANFQASRRGYTGPALQPGRPIVPGYETPMDERGLPAPTERPVLMARNPTEFDAAEAAARAAKPEAEKQTHADKVQDVMVRHADTINAAVSDYEAGKFRKFQAEGAADRKLQDNMRAFAERLAANGVGQSETSPGFARLIMDRFGVPRDRALSVVDDMAHDGVIEPDIARREFGHLYETGGRPNRGMQARGQERMGTQPDEPRSMVTTQGERDAVAVREAERIVDAEDRARRNKPSEGMPPDEGEFIGRPGAPRPPPAVEEPFRREDVRGYSPFAPKPHPEMDPKYAREPASTAAFVTGEKPTNRPASKPVVSPDNPAVIDVDKIQMPKGRGQRGAVGGPLSPEERARVERARGVVKRAVIGLGRAARATGESFMGTGLEEMGRQAPTGMRYFARASTSREYGDAVGTILEGKVTEGMKKADGEKYAGEKFGYAMTEEELRSLEDSYRDKGADAKHANRFKAFFPTDAELQKTWNDPAYRDFVDRHQAVFDQAVQPMNVQATGKDFDLSGRGVATGVRGNLVPISEEQGAGGIFTKRIGAKQSTVAKEAVGGAFDYDPRLSNRYAHAVRQAWEITNTKAAIEGMVRDGAAQWYDKNPNRRPPKGWIPFDVVKSAGDVKITAATGEPVEVGQRLYVDPRLEGEIKTFARMNEVPKPKGLFGLAHKGLTALQLASPVDKVFHTLNLAAANYRVGGKNPLAFVSHYKAFSDPVVRAKAVKRLAEIGASKPVYEKSGIRKWLDSERVNSFVDKARLYDLDRVDLAVRTAILDNVESLIKKGVVPDTLEARRSAVLQAGNYNARTQEYIVRALKTYGIQPFAVAARTMFANALRGSPLGGFSKGVPATSIAGAARLRGEVMAKWVAYLAAAGVNNYMLTGQMAPLGIGRWVSPFGKDKDGNWQEWPLPGAATGFSRMAATSGVQDVADTLQEGGTLAEGLGKGAVRMGNAAIRSVAGGPGPEALGTLMGARVGFGHYGGVGSSEADPGKAARNMNAWVDAIIGVVKMATGDEDEGMGQIAHDAFGPLFPRKAKQR